MRHAPISAILTLALILALALACPPTSNALNLDSVKNLGSKLLKSDETGSSSSSSSLAESDIITALKQALDKAVESSVDFLGQDGGYLNTPEVTIPLPDELQMIGKGLRAIGQDEIVDEFVTSMNSAAEEAAPQTLDIFVTAIKDMSFDDARQILDGEDDAATQYFERTTSGDLTELIRPIVTAAMQQTGVTSAYSSLTSAASSTASMVGYDVQDLEGYVTQKALDGLFYMIAQEEAQIRNDPVQWTTDILKKVFGAVS